MRKIEVVTSSDRPSGEVSDQSVRSGKSFTTERRGKGTREWSDRSCNICDGCQHGCLYCFAKAMRGRFDAAVRQPGGWERQRLKQNNSLGKGVCSNQVVMFPTSHDITPEFVGESLTTVKNLIADGNHVLIVSKPHLSVVRALCRELHGRQDRIMFRFTVGALDKLLCEFWEPGAPAPAERIRALAHAFTEGFRTSVSIEPMLDSVDATIDLVNRLEPFVTDTIWVGKMQRIPTKLNAHIPGFELARDLIRSQQIDLEILRMVGILETKVKVRWKDSIKAVINRRSQGLAMANVP